jgi:hypothetical protein
LNRKKAAELRTKAKISRRMKRERKENFIFGREMILTRRIERAATKEVLVFRRKSSAHEKAAA